MVSETNAIKPLNALTLCTSRRMIIHKTARRQHPLCISVSESFSRTLERPQRNRLRDIGGMRNEDRNDTRAGEYPPSSTAKNRCRHTAHTEAQLGLTSTTRWRSLIVLQLGKGLGDARNAPPMHATRHACTGSGKLGYYPLELEPAFL